MQSIGNILPSLLNNLAIEEAVKLKFLRKKWREIFSPPLVDHIYPKEIREGLLYVSVNSHTWLNELKLLREDFLKKLIPYGIKDVEFKFGKIRSIEQNYENKNKVKTLSTQQQVWINDVVKEVNDEEMRTIIKNLVTKYLETINGKIKGDSHERF